MDTSAGSDRVAYTRIVQRILRGPERQTVSRSILQAPENRGSMLENNAPSWLPAVLLLMLCPTGCGCTSGSGSASVSSSVAQIS